MRRWLIAIITIVVVCALATGAWNAATSMSHGFTWGVKQGVKAVFDLLTWVVIVGLFVAGGALVIQYGIHSDEPAVEEGG
jgi:hypothetical protein